jgi:serine/threonine-protein kinase
VLGALKKSEAQAGKPGGFGRFYLQELINSGGMAEIWLATDTDNRAYALRRMHERYRFDFMAKRRFAKGCELLASISDHPAIISYIEHGKISGQPYLLMEYVEAENLKELYSRHDPVLLENVAQILLDMAEALDHMHNNGYMHLDFKPENVLVTRNGSVRLIDFDLAKPITEKPVKLGGKNPGTPAYMAPEQLQGHGITQRVDIFSYGVAAYELLTNHKPFPGETPGKILQMMLDRDGLACPRELNPDVPVALEKVIMRCLDPEPERRYPVMGVLLRELQSALYV